MIVTFLHNMLIPHVNVQHCNEAETLERSGSSHFLSRPKQKNASMEDVRVGYVVRNGLYIYSTAYVLVFFLPVNQDFVRHTQSMLFVSAQ